MQNLSIKFQVICSGFTVLAWFEKEDPRGRGEGVPTDRRGELTESQLRKSKNLAKRRLQKILTKSKNMKRQFAELCESDILQNSAKATKTEAKLPQHLQILQKPAVNKCERRPGRTGRPRRPARGSYRRRGPHRAPERRRAPEHRSLISKISLKIAEILADFYKTFAKFTNILLNLLFFGNFELIFQKF